MRPKFIEKLNQDTIVQGMNDPWRSIWRAAREKKAAQNDETIKKKTV
ncbi:hypothetical protein BsIDN1_44340 [Bacillus safensis]|uniref:Uncharacterized protein n=1 Tax=Bacillus safensis TaxID=561879 RepID=A0A5S9MGS4_BACIA|nr:hypothetical protein BsIDN1_44340 [Bacillus safensis]